MELLKRQKWCANQVKKERRREGHFKKPIVMNHLPGRPAVHQEYTDNETRRQSFSLTYLAVVDIVLLAELGLFESRDRNGHTVVLCYHCGLQTKRWEPGDDPVNWLLHLSPDCPHLHTVLPVDVVNFYFNEFDPNVIDLFNARLQSDRGVVNLSYTDLSQRIRSFENWPVRYIDRVTLAEAGFFYTGIRDIVRCFYCNGVLHNWTEDHDPWTRHRFHYPTCQYVQQIDGGVFIQHAQPEIHNNVQNGATLSNDGSHADVHDSNEDSATVEMENPIEFICKQCKVVQPDTLLLPCAHLWFCWECATSISICPVCKKRITHKQKYTVDYRQS